LSQKQEKKLKKLTKESDCTEPTGTLIGGNPQ
jgi:hypothetical protein